MGPHHFANSRYLLCPVLFTGSTRVGRIVGAAAAKFNTPTTMELGGKCPVIVDPRKADLELVARRILWGRVGNGGQVCVSPDYVLIPRGSQKDLVTELKKVYKEFFPEDPLHSDSLTRLVSPAAAKRVKGYLDETKGQIVIGGQSDPSTRYIEPTVVVDVKGEDSTMQEEIFGPVLSIVPVDNLDEAISFLGSRYVRPYLLHLITKSLYSRPLPLALYVFSHDEAFKAKGDFLKS